MDAMMVRVEEYLAKGKRQIVFSQFRSALVEFEKRLHAKGIRAVRFDGSTPAKLRDEIKADFRDADNPSPQWDVVLVHYRTGGAGLTLNGTSVTHILDEEWNAGKRDQSYARNHRLGQDEETNVHIYRAPGVDMWMANLIRMKERMVTKLGEAMSAEKTIRLITEAVKKGEI